MALIFWVNAVLQSKTELASVAVAVGCQVIVIFGY